MSFKLLIRQEAELEILEAAEYYENEKPGLGLEFLDELTEAHRNLAEHPQYYFNIAPKKSSAGFYSTVFHTS